MTSIQDGCCAIKANSAQGETVFLGGNKSKSRHNVRYVVSTSAFIFFILYVKPIRSLLIQRTPAGSSFRLFALTFYSLFWGGGGGGEFSV